MIATLTLNPSIDLFMETGDLKMGETNRAKSETCLPGGKGLNVSLLLSVLGEKSRAWVLTGGFTGEKLKALTEARGLKAEYIDVPGSETRINVKVRSEKNEEHTEINGSGTAPSEAVIREIKRRIDGLTKEDVLVLSGSIPPGVEKTIYAELMKETEAETVVDASGELMRNSLQERPFLVKPNRAELSEITGLPVNTEEEIQKGAETLQKMGARNVLVSLGAEGALLLSEGHRFFRKPAPEVPEGRCIVNPVSAGDSMLAGFLYMYGKTKDMEKAFSFSLCCGTASALSEGVADRETVELLYRGENGFLK